MHALSASIEQVATRFGAEAGPSIAMPAETVEGGQGIVVVARDDRRLIRSMIWGFPRPSITGGSVGVTERVGLVADLTNPMWDGLVQDPKYRCLIPITHFANPDGEPGAKTRTWFWVKDQPIAAWAGFCRNVDGAPIYAGMTTEANAAIPPTNDRMPVLLEDGDWDGWLGGSIADVIRYQFRPPIAAARMRVARTSDRWRSGGGPPERNALEPLLL